MTKHLLIVTASDAQRALLVADLGAADFELSVARDGQEALELLHERSGEIDLIISDIVMPRLDGLELCRRLKSDSSLPDIPVVLLTSLQDPLDIVRGLEVGADNLLTEPYEADHLIARVEAILTGQTERRSDDDVTYLQLLGQRFPVTAERQQVLELLVGAFSDLVHANQRLRERELELAEVQSDMADRLGQVDHERARWAAVLDAIPDGVMIAGADGRITDANRALSDLGILPAGEDLTGTHVRDLPITVFNETGRELPPAAWPLVLAYHDGRTTTTGTDLVIRTADRHLPVTITAAPVANAEGRPSGAVAVVRDVSTWAFHDRLTALPNRTLFVDRIERARLRAEVEGAQAAVLVVGIDRFTVIHDSLGRGAEDSLVVAIARRLVSTVRHDATVGRLGNDRFGILLDHLPDATHAVHVASRVAEAVARPVTLGHEEIFLTASIGVATSSEGLDAEELLRHASTAMHQAAERGGACSEIYDEKLDTDARRRLLLDAALRRGLEHDEFVVHYQPVMSLDSGLTVETEALVRWQRPGHGLIPPSDFIPLAEDSGLIVPLGRWVLDQACHQTQRWRREGPDPHLRVSVNVAARELDGPELGEAVSAALDASGLPAHALTLEVTESALMRDPQRAATTLQGLRLLGVRIAIDDFGTGYSSLAYLRTFPLDVLKIDRSFVQQVNTDPETAAIAQAIITLAASLGLTVSAEGVETRDQLDWLRDAGCQHAAGFLLCRPIPAADVQRRIERPLVLTPD